MPVRYALVKPYGGVRSRWPATTALGMGATATAALGTTASATAALGMGTAASTTWMGPASTASTTRVGSATVGLQPTMRSRHKQASHP